MINVSQKVLTKEFIYFNTYTYGALLLAHEQLEMHREYSALWLLLHWG